jgi:hypothetical protein
MKIYTKRCTKCKKILPVKNFYAKRYSNGYVGFRSNCKDCECKRVKLYRNRDKTLYDLNLSDSQNKYISNLVSNLKIEYYDILRKKSGLFFRGIDSEGNMLQEVIE